MTLSAFIAALQAVPNPDRFKVMLEDHSDFGTTFEPVQQMELRGDWLVIK